VLDAHEKELQRLQEMNDVDDLIIQVLQAKIANFHAQIAAIEQMIKEKAEEKLRFSIEYLFQTFGIINKNIQIQFLTISEAYKWYGEYITGCLYYDRDELPAPLGWGWCNYFIRIRFENTLSSCLI